MHFASKRKLHATADFTGIGFAPNPGPGYSEQSASFTIGEKKIVFMLRPCQRVHSTFPNAR
jgi:hypothetical protein